MSFYTYAHYTKDTNQLFYIGKGSFTKQGDFKRAFAKTGRNAYWKNKTNKPVHSMPNATRRHLVMIKSAVNHHMASQNMGWVMADKILDK